MPSILTIRVLTEEVSKTIDTLKPETSAGDNEVSLKLVKVCREDIFVPLTSIINKSYKQRSFPNNFKISSTSQVLGRREN